MPFWQRECSKTAWCARTVSRVLVGSGNHGTYGIHIAHLLHISYNPIKICSTTRHKQKEWHMTGRPARGHIKAVEPFRVLSVLRAVFGSEL